jgi:hypothetical protein
MSNEIPVKEKETLVEKKMRELEEKRGLPSGDGLSVTEAYRERFRKGGTLRKWSRGKGDREDGKETLSSPVGKDDYQQLKTEQRREMAGLRSASDYPERRTTDMTLEGVKSDDKDQGKVPVNMTDEEANKSAHFEAGLSGGLHSDQALTGAIAGVVGDRTNQVPDAGPSVSGLDDRLEYQRDVGYEVSKKESGVGVKGVFLETRIGGHRDDEILSSLWGKKGLSLRYIRNKDGESEGDDWLLFGGKKKKRGGEDLKYMVPAKVLLDMGRVGGSYADAFSERYGIDRPSAGNGEEFVKRMKDVFVNGQGLGAENVSVLEIPQEEIISMDPYKEYYKRVNNDRVLRESIRGKDKSGTRRRGFEIGSDEVHYFGDDEKNMAKFFEVWKDEDIDNKDLKGRVFKNKKGDLMFSLQGGGKEALVKVGSLEIIAAEYDENYGWGNWTKGFLDELSVDGVMRKGVKVEIDGSVNRPKGPRKMEERKARGSESDEGRVRVMVDFDRLGRNTDKNETRKRVRGAVGLMRMTTSGEPKFKVGDDQEGVLSVEVSNGDRLQEVGVDDLLRVIPQVSRMGRGDGVHWSTDGMGVDRTSTNEEWSKFLGSLDITGVVKK